MTVPRLPPSALTALSNTTRRVWNLERAIASAAPTGLVTGESGPIIAVAAANTPAVLKRFAAFVCDGIDDQATVLLACREIANGGEVWMLPGDFYFSTYINSSTFFTPTSAFGGVPRVRGSGYGAVVVHFTGSLAFANTFELFDLTFSYEGDPTVGAGGAAGVSNLYRCVFWNCAAYCYGRMVECETYGRYAPDGGYIPGLSRAFSAYTAERCKFGCVTPDLDMFAVGGNGGSCLDCVFDPAPFSTVDANFCRSVITIGPDTGTIGTNTLVRGNRILPQGSTDPDEMLVDYCVRNFGDSFGAIIESNVFQALCQNSEGDTGVFAPFIFGVDYDNGLGRHDVTVRNHFALGGDPMAVTFDFLPEQGYGTP